MTRQTTVQSTPRMRTTWAFGQRPVGKTDVCETMIIDKLQTQHCCVQQSCHPESSHHCSHRSDADEDTDTLPEPAADDTSAETEAEAEAIAALVPLELPLLPLLLLPLLPLL